MDNNEIKYSACGLFFTWDEDKAEVNFKKHGITFEVAAEAFYDEYYLEYEERRDGETRYKIVGKTFSSFLVFVVFVERLTVEGAEVFRIISARKATRKETLDYEEGLRIDAEN
jgi:uncharacterized DUF497 family protein